MVNSKIKLYYDNEDLRFFHFLLVNLITSANYAIKFIFFEQNTSRF